MAGGSIHTIDVELTNRCNARCGFCPRDRTPAQGRMSEAVLVRTLERAVEHREEVGRLLGAEVRLSFSGLGEPLLHRDAARYVRLAADAGFAPSMSTNGALLGPERAAELVEAGLGALYVNCGDLDGDYEQVYGLPFERLVANVRRFLDIAGDACDVYVVLVDHHPDPARIEAVRAFWQSVGVRRFFASPLVNRGGSLAVEGLSFAGSTEEARAVAELAALGPRPACASAFAFPFVGWDGRYYLCAADWEKRVPCGDVFEHSILDTWRARLDVVTGREPICRHCSQDPVNRLAALLGGVAGGEPLPAAAAELAAALSAQAAATRADVATVATARPGRRPLRRRIPVAVDHGT